LDIDVTLIAGLGVVQGNNNSNNNSNKQISIAPYASYRGIENGADR